MHSMPMPDFIQNKLLEIEFEELVDQGYLLRNGFDERTEEPLYCLNYMKHPNATEEEEEDVIMLRLPDGSVQQGLRIFLKEGWEEA